MGLSFFLGDLELEGPDVPTDGLQPHLHSGDVVFVATLTRRSNTDPRRSSLITEAMDPSKLEIGCLI